LISADLAVSLINSWKLQTAIQMNNSRKNQHFWGSSLKNMLWDNSDDISDSQRLISSTIHEWYDAKHREPSDDEIAFLNNIPISRCPRCGSTHIVKNGYYKDGMQCYFCRSCHSKFSPVTNTIFDDKKIPISEWIEYLLYLFEFHSISTTARDNRNAVSTGRYWLKKVFYVLRGIQDNVVLDGDIYFEGMFFPVVKSKTVVKDGKKLRGISKNKICVAAAHDEWGNTVIIVENVSKPSRKSTWNAMGSHIKPGSNLIHDGDNSHSVLVEKLSLMEEVYTTKETKGLSDDKNPLDPINNLHSLAKRYMKSHGGYSRDDLQDWMNLIWFVLSKPDNRYQNVNKFIELAINTPGTLRYRDVMSKKRSV
jgi:transposase-like protein